MAALKIETAPTVQGATDYLNSSRSQFAMLDVNLGIDISFSDCGAIRDERVPPIFAGEYGDDWNSHSGAGIYCVAKPYDRDRLEAATFNCLREFTVHSKV